ncbi:hypothetical protein ATE92_2247 [Ulvibacter sp. MAR_2010_11]|uniref:alpha/beta hydrolase n=1 Tax=Ulvibacter sp. MAR_2010_11 TaxID=1250229 RepID=UPI000C2C67B0|nr:alpha/beta hydrolase [Ulvibacter sp. MAR_2010_11]PKA84077.1 hypothetical protein ATE92_2247 [Ulvibacter sp. MAR_2010_11]
MKRLKKLFVFVFFAVLFGITVLYFMQEKLLFHPSTLPQEYTFQFEETFEEIFLETEDGAKLNAIHFKNENPKGVILYFHGNAGDLSRWGEVTSYFTQFQYDVLVMDYRTYGKSSGALSEKAFFKDAQLFYDHLLKSYGEHEIIVYGRSLGTSMAAYVASQNNPKQLLLETPFYSMEDVAKSRFPFLPVKLLLRYKFPTYRFIKDVTCPIVIFHGTEDNTVPYASAKKLVVLIPPKRVSFITITGGNHNDLINFNAYTTEIETILQ